MPAPFPPPMQTISLIALVQSQFDERGPVFLRVMNQAVEFLSPVNGEPANLVDNDEWEILENCTAEDLPELQQIVEALGEDPAQVLQQFPNCTDY